MTWREALRPKAAIVDAAVIGCALVGANLLVGRSDPGWSGLNPSPYLLLPLLLGGRYGFMVGLLSGIAASLIVALLQTTGDLGSLRVALASTPYLHASLPFVGAVSGELFGWLRRERAQSEAQLAKSQLSVRRLDADVRYLRGVKDELDRAVAARDGEVSTLDAELRRLSASSHEDLPTSTLQFLKRQVRLADAAIYQVGRDGGPLMRAALIGRDTHLPAEFSPADSTMVRLALERSSLVTLPELLRQKAPPTTEKLLLTAPLRDSHGRTLALLAVSGMPFISFTPQTANLIALICGWAGEVFDLASGAATGRYRIVAGKENQRIFTRQHLRHLLQLALEANQAHRLPSSVVVFRLRGAPAREQGRFEQVLVSAIRAGDYAAELEFGEPHLAVLLPLVGERGASIFVERARQFLRSAGQWPGELEVRRIEFGRAETVDELMAEIDGNPATNAAR